MDNPFVSVRTGSSARRPLRSRQVSRVTRTCSTFRAACVALPQPAPDPAFKPLSADLHAQPGCPGGRVHLRRGSPKRSLPISLRPGAEAAGIEPVAQVPSLLINGAVSLD